MPIIIKKENFRPEVQFSSLSCGDTFLYKNEIHMKVIILGSSPADEYATAIRLSTGTENYFDDKDLVVPVKEATLTYSMI